MAFLMADTAVEHARHGISRNPTCARWKPISPWTPRCTACHSSWPRTDALLLPSSHARHTLAEGLWPCRLRLVTGCSCRQAPGSSSRKKGSSCSQMSRGGCGGASCSPSCWLLRRWSCCCCCRRPGGACLHGFGSSGEPAGLGPACCCNLCWP